MGHSFISRSMRMGPSTSAGPSELTAESLPSRLRAEPASSFSRRNSLHPPHCARVLADGNRAIDATGIQNRIDRQGVNETAARPMPALSSQVPAAGSKARLPPPQSSWRNQWCQHHRIPVFRLLCASLGAHGAHPRPAARAWPRRRSCAAFPEMCIISLRRRTMHTPPGVAAGDGLPRR